MNDYIAGVVAKGDTDQILYQLKHDAVTAMDRLWGNISGRANRRIHRPLKTGFTAKSLKRKLIDSGFWKVDIMPDNQFNLWAMAYKTICAESSAFLFNEEQIVVEY
ncbi:MAG: hypothetical protein U9O82_01685 [Thermodesulfobacteriota bacterium]|nr:hypothetical protein [Thermodesulfobacteriota bacterium]